MSSDSENESASSSTNEKLGVCEACNANPAKYTCPRCEVKTCGLSCLNLHKRELKCDGIRDRTKYIPLVKMTKMDLMNDYYFLEECTKFVEDRKRDRNKRYTRYNKNLPSPLFRLRQAANERGTSLRFLLQNFTKRQKNTSLLEFKSGTIFWRVEWCFPNGNEALLFVDERISEKVKLYEAVDKYLQPAANECIPGISKLAHFQSQGIASVQVLLKAEGIKGCRNRFFPLDINKTISQCLAGKTIVEYPTIFVVLKVHLEEYNVIESDDDVESEMRQYNHYINQSYMFETMQDKQTEQTVGAEGIADQLDEMEIDRLKQDKRKQHTREQPLQNPMQFNFLFSDDSVLNQLSSDTDQGASTEEETDTTTSKRVKTTS